MFLNPKATFFIPNQSDPFSCLKKITHMAIVAHQDDLEILSYHGILSCYRQPEKSYFGVVVTDGAGSARSGVYAKYTDEEMKEIRSREQEKAAIIGEYGALAQLRYTSKETKDPKNDQLVNDLTNLLLLTKPKVLYTHNLADKHDTHIGVATKVILAIRALPKEDRPQVIYGCEVWRDLDWLDDSEKVCLDVSGQPDLAAALLEVFDSQIAGGKRYDQATLGRRLANATYYQSHFVDQANAVTFALNLTPLIENDELSLEGYIISLINRFRQDVQSRIRKMQ